MSARSKSFLEGMRKKSSWAVIVLIIAMVIFIIRVLQINIKMEKSILRRLFCRRIMNHQLYPTRGARSWTETAMSWQTVRRHTV